MTSETAVRAPALVPPALHPSGRPAPAAGAGTAWLELEGRRARVLTRGSFSLRELATFGFGQREAGAYDGRLRLGFCLDGTWEPTGLVVTQPAPGLVEMEVVGDVDPARAVAQGCRVLSLDVDGAGFDALGRRDPVLRRLLAAAPGLRPPLFHSVYKALAWAVLSARRPARQMHAVRRRLSEQSGTVLTVGGRAVPVLPSPGQLLEVAEVPGLTEEKVVRLHGVARAALDGRLDVDVLRALEPALAAAQLRSLRGVGAFSAQLAVVRALGHADVLPESEPVGLAVVGELYGLGRPAGAAELAVLAEQWRPFRTWALVLARAAAPRLAERQPA